MPGESKTEKATPKRRRDERKKGNVFFSRDAVSVVTLLGTGSMFLMMADNIAEKAAAFMKLCLASCGNNAEIGIRLEELVRQSLYLLGVTVFPIALTAAACAITATFFQTKLLVSGELIKPKFNRLNPLQGFKRLFSLQSIVETVKNLIKITLLMSIVYITLKGMFLESPRYLYADVSAACRHVFENGKTMVLRIVIAFVGIAVLDYFYQWWEYERKLKMSKQEVKEEYKQTEGDPQIKGKIKQIQRQRAQQRMMQQVPQADVVIRNPTHFAVALRYHPDEDNAPIVLAKGQDAVALRIVKVAEDSKVTVIENVPLARALYAQTEIGWEIPPELYGAVAEVLVYIFRLNEKKQLVK